MEQTDREPFNMKQESNCCFAPTRTMIANCKGLSIRYSTHDLLTVDDRRREERKQKQKLDLSVETIVFYVYVVSTFSNNNKQVYRLAVETHETNDINH